jgi:hypothetical protein
MEISVDGLRVAEAESFANGDDAAARAEGAELLWVHSNDDLSAHGFRRAGAYVLAEPPEGAVVVGVPVVGLCPVFPAERLIDGPKILPEGRSPDAYASLLVSACAVLGAGPADLDSWGDAEETIEAYEDLGFDVVERVQGWELAL